MNVLGFHCKKVIFSVGLVSTGHRKDKSERKGFIKHTQLAFWLVRGRRVGEESAPFKQDLVKVRDHPAGIAEAVPFLEQPVHHRFVIRRPVLLGTARRVKLAFLFEDNVLDEDKDPLLQQVELHFSLVGEHKLGARTVNDVAGGNQFLDGEGAVIDAEYRTDAQVHIDQRGAVKRIKGYEIAGTLIHHKGVFLLFADDGVNGARFGELLFDDQITLDIKLQLRVAGCVLLL